MSTRLASSVATCRRAVGVVCLVAIAFGLYGLRRGDVPVVPAKTLAASPVLRAEPATSLRAPAETPLVDAALFATPEAQAHFAYERFQSRARRFFAQAAALDASARVREARELSADIDAYEQRRMLSAGEAMTLRIGLVEATAGSPSERADEVAAIVARYESDGQQREARWLAQQAGDAAFVRYKARESVVVAEVMSLAQIPEGLSRDEYLRRRLEAERVAAMQ
jgi:hypothetical protein